MNRPFLIIITVLVLLMAGCAKKMVKDSSDEIEVGPPELAGKTVEVTPIEKGETLIMEGAHLFENDKKREALAVWRKAFQLLPDDSELLNWLGVGYYKIEQYDSAIYFYQKAIDLDPNHYQAYNNLGYAYFTQKKYSRALANFEKALALNPYFDQAKLNFETTKKIIDGELTFRALELFEKAATEDSLEIKLKYYKNAINLDTSYVEAYNNMGVAYYYLGNVDSSIIYLNRAITINPGYPEANNNLGFILSQLGLDDKAVPLYLAALNVKSNYLVAMINLTDSYIRLKNYGNAQKVLTSAKKLSPDDPLVRRRERQVEYLIKQN